MTAETLKPFITPTSGDHFPSVHTSSGRRPLNRSPLLVMGLSVTCLVLVGVCAGLTIWNSVRVSNLEADLKDLNQLVDSMQKHLGIDYLKELQDFEKEYTNALIDDPNSIDDDDVDDDDDDVDDEEEEEEEEDDIDHDEDDDDDEDDEDDVLNGGHVFLPDSEELDYDDMLKKYNNYDDDDDDDEDDDDDSNTSDDDNLYDDFEKFKDSKKKKQRKTRSIANTANGLPIYEESLLERLNRTNGGHALERDSHQELRQRQPTMRPSQPSVGSRRAHGKRQIVSEKLEEKLRSPLRPRSSHRRRKLPMVKSGDSLLSAKTTGNEVNAIPFTQHRGMVAAHFHLKHKVEYYNAPIKVDTFVGDMYIGEPNRTNVQGMEQFFQLDRGLLRVREPGLYYIYAQVCYNNKHDNNGFLIFHGHHPFLQCLNTVPTNITKLHTCHTSGIVYLEANETIHLRDIHPDHSSILKNTNDRSYFGLIKL